MVAIQTTWALDEEDEENRSYDSNGINSTSFENTKSLPIGNFTSSMNVDCLID